MDVLGDDGLEGGKAAGIVSLKAQPPEDIGLAGGELVEKVLPSRT